MRLCVEGHCETKKPDVKRLMQRDNKVFVSIVHVHGLLYSLARVCLDSMVRKVGGGGLPVPVSV